METNPNSNNKTFTGSFPGSPNDPDICPRCGTRRSAIKGMLGEPVNSPAYHLGKEKVMNCWECRAAILETAREKAWSPKR
jgi:hypothetical protein